MDVGVNFGIYSLYATSVSKEVKVFAIEPSAETFKELMKNIHLHDYSSQIVPELVALSFASGEGRMIGNDGRFGSSCAQFIINSNSSSVSVGTMTGDEIRGQLSDPLVIIKIDTDGNEFDVLCGLKQSFERGLIESVLVETTSANVLRIDDFLKSHDLVKDVSYLDIEGHSNHRHIRLGNKERSKIFPRPIL